MSQNQLTQTNQFVAELMATNSMTREQAIAFINAANVAANNSAARVRSAFSEHFGFAPKNVTSWSAEDWNGNKAVIGADNVIRFF